MFMLYEGSYQIQERVKTLHQTSVVVKSHAPEMVRRKVKKLERIDDWKELTTTKQSNIFPVENNIRNEPSLCTLVLCSCSTYGSWAIAFLSLQYLQSPWLSLLPADRLQHRLPTFAKCTCIMRCKVLAFLLWAKNIDVRHYDTSRKETVLGNVICSLVKYMSTSITVSIVIHWRKPSAFPKDGDNPSHSPVIKKFIWQAIFRK